VNAWIIGAGAQGRVVLDILRAQRLYDSIGFIDDNPALHGSTIKDAEVLGGFDLALAPDQAGAEMIVAIGHPLVRLRLAQSIAERGGRFLNAIHPSAVIMGGVKLGAGNMIGPAAVVNSDSQIGDHTIVNTGAIIEHDCVLEDGAAAGPGANVGGRVHLGRASFLAAGAVVIGRVRIGSETVVGAGAVVTKDLPPKVLALGVPARITEHLENFDWKRVL
jgi:acetyltransferase EpsM